MSQNRFQPASVSSLHSTAWRAIAISWVVLFSQWIANPVLADGIIQKLPEDGQWSRYDFELLAIDKEGKLQVISSGSYTIRSVGRKEFEDEMCRWIELEQRSTAKNPKDKAPKEFVEILQLVVPEANWVGGDNPLDHIVQAWQKYPNSRNGGAGHQDLDILRKAILPPLFHGAQKNAKKLDPKNIQTKPGEFKNCQGVSSSQVLFYGKKPNQGEDQFQYEVYQHADAPFGVVELQTKHQRKFTTGQIVNFPTWRLKLAESGTGAVPLITTAETEKLPPQRRK